MMMWKNYGNNHTIFDASAGTSPSGSAISNTDSANAWTGTYPTLMGWNGSSTYGVRVDRARLADSATTAAAYLPLVGGTLSGGLIGTSVDMSGGIDANEGMFNNIDGLRLINPGGGSTVTQTSTVTGAIKITLPVSHTNTMMRMTVKVYEYDTNESFTVVLGGYNYSSGNTWYNCFAYIESNATEDRNFTVRFGYASSKGQIYIGELNSQWNYPQVFVTDFQAGYSSYTASAWQTGWDVNYESSSFGSVTRSIGNPQVNNWARDGVNLSYTSGSGNVGIGTISPDEKLTVNGITRAVNPIYFGAINTDNGTYGPYIQSFDNKGLKFDYNGNTGGEFQVWNHDQNGGGAFQVFTIDQDGDVGIGNTSPGAKLDVAGSINTSGSINLTNAGLNTIAASNPSNGYLRFLVDQQGVALTLNADTTSTFGGRIYAVDGNKATPGYSFTSDPDTGMFRDSANVLVLGVNGDTRIRINNSDIVTYKPLAVNKTSITSSVALDVGGVALVGSSGVGDFYLGNYATANHFRFHTNNSQTYFDMNCGQINWRQGSSTRYYFYPSTANMTINGTLTQNSDSRVKENVVEIGNCISKVQAMRGVYYNRNDFNTEVTKVGVIAQEVEAVLPELILEAPDTGLKSVAYAELTAVLINAVKEQQEIIEDLKTRINKLEK